MSNDAISAFLEASVRTATPLAFAALGELVTERAGVINIGLEGAIIAGALGSLVFAGFGGVGLGMAGAVLGGVMIAAIFAFFVVSLRADQIITGTAISMLALGVTGTLRDRGRGVAFTDDVAGRNPGAARHPAHRFRVLCATHSDVRVVRDRSATRVVAVSNAGRPRVARGG
jgi:ABC-type uncharacterized transport system permease subunit